MNSSNTYQNVDTGVLMSANDYNSLSNAQKDRMIIKPTEPFDWENEFDKVWANKSPQFGYIGTKARQEIKDWIKENVIKKLQIKNK